jgi:hypothetical protein
MVVKDNQKVKHNASTVPINLYKLNAQVVIKSKR